jgi:outer membrane protein TolC
VELKIPCFEGFARDHRTGQAKAQAEWQRYALDEIRRQVALRAKVG